VLLVDDNFSGSFFYMIPQISTLSLDADEELRALDDPLSQGKVLLHRPSISFVAEAF